MADEKLFANNSLEDIKNLKIQAKQLESKAKKSGGKNVEKEMEDLRLSCLETASAYNDYCGDEFSEHMAEKFREPFSFKPSEVVLVLKDIVCDISELYVRAFKLMLENMSHSHIVKVETAYENDLFEKKWQSQERAFERQARRARRRKQEDTPAVDFSQDKAKTPKQRRSKRASAEFESAFKPEFTPRPRRTRSSSNIVFVRNNNLRPARSFAPSFSRKKQSEPTFSSPQMSM